MKRSFLLFCFTIGFASIFAQKNDPVIMKIGDKPILRSEFEYIWNKDVSENSVDKKSLDEYLDLFINFKLKVLEAESEGLDTTTAFKTELKGYRDQLKPAYFENPEAKERIKRELYERVNQYISVSHILIQCPTDASPEDTLTAWNKIMGLYNQLTKDKADFATLAKEYSEDNSGANGGSLGYVVGGQLIYPLETAAFVTPVGSVSTPVRTRYGYHLVKVLDRYPVPGRYKSAHILKLVSPTDSEEKQTAAKKAIFDIYNQLKAGADFATLAKEQSDDNGTASKGGEYPLQTCGSLPVFYEEAVFKQAVGQISAPIQSKYGWHIIKTLDIQPVQTYKERSNELESMIAMDERSLIPQNELIEKLKNKYNYTYEYITLKNIVYAFDRLRKSADRTEIEKLMKSTNPIFRVGGVSYSQGAFVKYVTENESRSNNINQAFTDYVNNIVLAFEDSRLEKKYPEFGHLMQEYRDGILLFEISNREIWEKAANDSAGLKDYFEKNKMKYVWKDAHFKGCVVQCKNKELATRIKNETKKMAADTLISYLYRTYNTDSMVLVQAQRGLYKKGENSLVDAIKFNQPVKSLDKTFPVTILIGKMLKKGPESYLDVRGLVISDYQSYLDEKWVETLRKKYPVTIYKEVANTVNNN